MILKNIVELTLYKISLSTFIIFLTAASFNSFQISAQSIKIISPNGGEKWEAKSKKNIKWESTEVKNVKIEYSLDNGISWKIIEHSVNASLGKYEWITADANTPYVLIKISDASDSKISDLSNETFQLVLTEKNLRKSLINGNPVRIMPLGDSITWGDNPDSPVSPGYRRILDSLLNNAGYNFEFVGSLTGGEPADFDRDNEGHSRWVAYHPNLPDRSLLDSLMKFLSSNPPDIILLHIGTNDLWDEAASTLADEVEDLLDTIFVFNPDITVVIAKIIDRADTEIRHNRTVAFNNTELPDMINSLPAARQEKIVMVNMYDSLGTYWNNFTNPNFTYLAGSNLHTLHPNTKGYSVMANVWYDALINILPPPTIYADIKIFLQGPYEEGIMRTDLNSKGYLQSNAQSQPYNSYPWNYNGSESVDSNFFISNPSIVDWVLVELRSKNDPCSTITSRAAFLLTDGRIADIDGTSSLAFENLKPDCYYIIIKHRNHLSVMSSDPVPLVNGTLSYDFTTGCNKFFGQNLAAKELNAGVWGMFCSDGDSDGIINSNDLNTVWKSANGLDGYSNGDYNLDGFINAIDKNLYWRLNNGLESKLPAN